MATCKDCVHIDLCYLHEHYGKDENDKACKKFKNKADFVEVVRCKDCTEWDKNECECSHWYGFRENDFCSYGERKGT